MRTFSRLTGVTFAVAGLLAISASAAQAMPAASSNDSFNAPAKRTILLHRTGLPLQSHVAPTVTVMQPAVDSPTDQTAPLIINLPAPAAATVSTDNGFGWIDAAVGAGVATLLLILAAGVAIRMRPRQTAQL